MGRRGAGGGVGGGVVALESQRRPSGLLAPWRRLPKRPPKSRPKSQMHKFHMWNLPPSRSRLADIQYLQSPKRSTARRLLRQAHEQLTPRRSKSSLDQCRPRQWTMVKQKPKRHYRGKQEVCSMR